MIAEHLDRLLTAAEAGRLKVVVDHQHTGAAPLSIEATVGVGDASTSP